MTNIFDDIDSLAEAAANRLISAAKDAREKRGRFILALSGGHSPRPLFRLLARAPYRDGLPWKETFVLWCDERCVPLDDERSNAGTAKSLLLMRVPVPADQIFPMYKKGMEPVTAAERYEAAIRTLFDSGQPRLDAALLGCGENGHTASLFPHSPVLKEKQALVRAVKPAESDIPRITMTPSLLNRSRLILFIVYGKEKAEAVHQVLEGPARPEQYPAQAIRPTDGELIWLLDRAAASGLDTSRHFSG
jgi:6-phosphogluconolactonase